MQANQAEHALDVSSRVRDVDVEQPVVDTLGMLDHELPEELPAPVPRRIREDVPAKPMADERESERKHQEGRPSHDPERRADERKARHAAGSVEREGDGQERAQRVGDHIDGRELERIHDVAQERPTVVEQVDAAIVERIGQPVTRPVDREHAVGLRERREDRHHLVCAAQPTVDVQKRRSAAELDYLCLALGPANPADARLRCEPGEQRSLRLLELPIQLCLHKS